MWKDYEIYLKLKESKEEEEGEKTELREQDKWK